MTHKTNVKHVQMTQHVVPVKQPFINLGAIVMQLEAVQLLENMEAVLRMEVGHVLVYFNFELTNINKSYIL